jgi:PAS domain S-box-containing protein
MYPSTAEKPLPMEPEQLRNLIMDNEILRREIRYARESAELTADLVVKQFEETERLLRQFQEANAQRKAVLDSALQVAIIATDNEGTITMFNKGAEQMLGYSAEEIIGKYTPELFHMASELEERAGGSRGEVPGSPRVVDLLLEGAGRRTPRETEWSYVRKDKTTLSVKLSINALRNAEGAMVGFLCMATDNTEKRRSELALKESERNYRLLVNRIPNIVFKGYADGTIEFFDDKIEALTGYPKEVFNQKKINWFDLILKEDLPSVREKFIEALRSDMTYIRQYRIRKKNGEILWIEAGSQIICDENGRIKFIMGAFLDITVRKEAERALHESEEKYRSLFDSGPNPIFVLDRETLEILDANPSAQETYGYSKDELIGKAFTELGPLVGDTGSENLLDADDWAGACMESQRASHKKRDGSPIFLKLKTCHITYRDRDAVILAATDITDSIVKDTQLFQASKMATLGELSTGVAHELNQPLNAIKIGNEYLRKVIKDGKIPRAEDLSAVATAVSAQVDRAAEIIGRLREFGRKPDIEKTHVSLNVPIRNVLGIIGRQLGLLDIDIKLDLDPDGPKILANTNYLEEVVFNILTNARDAIEQKAQESGGPSEKTILIKTFYTDENAGFKISDTGIGIPKHNREKVFEPFFTTKEVGKGVGLGLSMIYGIVRDFNGTIDIKDRTDGGTTFVFTFPRVN